MAASSLVVVADGLTSLRLLLAVGLIPIAWSQNLTVAAVMVSVAWLTDLLDGRLARVAGTPGRLGPWDLWADTAVGFGILAGLAGAGRVSVWLLAAGVVLLWVFARGNVAAGMLVQVSGYLPLLAFLWVERPSAWWIPFLTAVAIGVVDWRRLVMVNIPAFLRGLGLARTRIWLR